MSAESRFHKFARVAKRVLPRAIVETLVGGLLGLVTASMLVVSSLVFFPGLEDFDYDMGLRMHKFADEYLSYWNAGLVPDAKHVDSYMFVDVDPQLEPSPAAGDDDVGACSALAHVPSRCYTIQPGALAPKDRAACTQGQVVLNCSAARPLNRHLLAEIVKGVHERGARLIVLDVELADEPGVVDLAENLALRDAMRHSGNADGPVIFAQPAEYDSQHEPTGSHNARADPARLFDAALKADASGTAEGNGRPAFAAIALPAPGQPVRRYPKCFRNVWHGAKPSPSLPYAAAALLAVPETDPSSLCPESSTDGSGQDDGPYSAPRIRYTLPSLRAHQDATRDGEDFRMWSVYRQVYNRCLAAKFWLAESLCSRPEAYRGKVVVIGASNLLRRDRHYTPIGNMAGADVVINAIRSFVLIPQQRDKDLGEAVLKKVWIVLVCLLFWLVFFSFRGWVNLPSRHHSGWTARLGREASVFIAFAITLAVVLVFTFKASYSSFSVLVGTLSIAVEQYIEVVRKWVLNPFKRFLEHVLGPPVESTH